MTCFEGARPESGIQVMRAVSKFTGNSFAALTEQSQSAASKDPKGTLPERMRTMNTVAVNTFEGARPEREQHPCECASSSFQEWLSWNTSRERPPNEFHELV
eukprot:6475202-Amphidinium_carterae.2